MAKLRVRDLTGVIDILSMCGAVDTRRKLVATLLPMLGTLLHADEASFTVIARSAVAPGFTAGYPTLITQLPAVRSVWTSRFREHPWTPYAWSGHDAAVRLSDLKPRRELTRTAFYQDFYLARGVTCAAYATIARSPSKVVGIAASRDGRDFSSRDVELLDCLRRPLGGVWDHLQVLERLRRPAGWTLADGKTGLAQLTTAERRVVDLVVTGASNRNVATVLGISEKAVEQHLTHAYQKLAVTSRTQLALQIAGRGAR